MCSNATPSRKANNLNILSSLSSKNPSNLTTIKLKSFSPDFSLLKSRHDESVVFSFKLFDKSHAAFNLGGTGVAWFIDFLEAIRDISNGNWKKLRTELYGKYEAHPLDFNHTKYRFQFDSDTLNQNEAWQFRISKSKGRVHGFLVGNVFYIYWLDPHHNMYDCEGYEGYRPYKAPDTTCELLEKEVNDLTMANERLQKQFEEAETLYLNEVYKCEVCEFKA